MKKVLALVLTLAMVFALAACGQSAAPAAAPAADAPAAAPAADAPAADAAGVPDTIKIGVMGTMTGEQAEDGKNIQGSVALIQQELDAAGGLQVGDKLVQVEFVIGDTEAKPEQAVNVMQKFLNQDKVIAVIGPNNSSDCLSSYEVSQAAGVPAIASTATNVKVTAIGDYCFRACFIDPFQGLCMANYALNECGYKTAAVLSNQGDAYSTGLMESFVSAFEAGGGTIVANEVFAGTDVKDYNAQLTKIKNAEPDCIFIPNQNNMVINMCKQIKDMGITCQLFGCDSWDYDFLAKEEVTQGAIYTSGYAKDITSAKDFYDSFVALNGFEPGFPSAMTYEAIKILFNAIQTCQSVDGAALRDAIAATDMDLPCGHLTFDADRNPVKDCAIIQITDIGVRTYLTSVSAN